MRIGGLGHLGHGIGFGIVHEQGQHIVDGAADGLEAAIHVAFAEILVGIGGDLGGSGCSGDAEAHWQCLCHRRIHAVFRRDR